MKRWISGTVAGSSDEVPELVRRRTRKRRAVGGPPWPTTPCSSRSIPTELAASAVVNPKRECNQVDATFTGLFLMVPLSNPKIMRPDLKKLKVQPKKHSSPTYSCVKSLSRVEL